MRVLLHLAAANLKARLRSRAMTAVLRLAAANLKTRIRSRALRLVMWCEGKYLVGDTLLDRMRQEWL